MVLLLLMMVRNGLALLRNEVIQILEFSSESFDHTIDGSEQEPYRIR